jgi:hypothetical protein
LVEETGVPKKTTDLSQATDYLSHNSISSILRHERGSNSQLGGIQRRHLCYIMYLQLTR